MKSNNKEMWMITLEKRYCQAILDGRKKIEVRTRLPRDIAARDIVLVCMKGTNGHVPFSFEIDAVGIFYPNILWDLYQQQLAIEKTDYLAYTKGRPVIYGLHIGQVNRYGEGVTIDDFGVNRSPQWFTKVPPEFA